MRLEEVKNELKTITKKGDIKKLAKKIKVDHELGIQLWTTEDFHSMLLATLIFDKKKIDSDFMRNIARTVDVLDYDDRNYVSDWLLANQLVKGSNTIELLESFIDSDIPFLRRLFWYYQGRLRWTGKTEFENTKFLVEEIKKRLSSEDDEVKWAINFCAGWIGVFDPIYREELISFGSELGLYKDDKVSRNCTPNYLPSFIEIEAKKRKLI